MLYYWLNRFLAKICNEYLAYKADISLDNSNRFKKLYNDGRSSSKKLLPQRGNIDNGSYNNLARVSTSILKE